VNSEKRGSMDDVGLSLHGNAACRASQEKGAGGLGYDADALCVDHFSRAARTCRAAAVGRAEALHSGRRLRQNAQQSR